MSATPRLFGWWGVMLAWMVWGAINILRLGVMPEHSWSQAVSYGLPDVVVWASLTPFIVWISRRFEIRGERRWRHLAVHIGAALVTLISHSAADASLSAVVGFLSGSSSHWWFVFVKILRYQSHTNLLIYTLVSGFVHYQIYAQRLARESARASQLAAQLNAAKLTNLRRQLRPHFLFNALNSIAASMEDDPARGRLLVRRLGELLRASLRDDSHQLISLEQEIELLRAYLEVEKARYGDRLDVQLEVQPETLSCRVPALLLQPIVENAVTHGIAPQLDGGRIDLRTSIEGERLVVEVEDDGAGFPVPTPRAGTNDSGIGLANTKERIDTLFGPEATLTFGSKLPDSETRDSGAQVRIELPVRRSEAA